MKNRLLIAFSLCLIFTQIFVTLPGAIWAQNKSSFNSNLIDFAPIFIVFTILILILSFVLSFLVPSKVLKKATIFLTLIATILFCQQTFLVWNYGVLDGTDLNFSKNNVLGLIDLLFWVLPVILTWRLSEKIWPHIKTVQFAIGITMFTSFGVTLSTYGEFSQVFPITEKDKYAFSKKENIIVFMLDAYQNDLLEEVLDQHPEFVDNLEGFTLYENNAAVFAKTLPSIPLLLTGKAYNKDEPIADFFDSVYANSLLENLQTEGWDVGLYPETSIFPSIIQSIDLDPKYMDNIVEVKGSSTGWSEYLTGLDLSLFRSVPHQLKKMIFNNGDFWARQNLVKYTSNNDAEETDLFIYPDRKKHHAVEFAEELSEFSTVELDDPAFRFYHFIIPHAPFVLDRDLNKAKHNGKFSTYQAYSFVSWKLMDAYLAELKKHGVYDNSTIIILSDHGLGNVNKRQYNNATKSYKSLKQYGLERSAAKSILLIKEAGDSFPLQRSSKPVSGIDIAPTISKMAGIDGAYEGIPIDELSADQSRPRKFNYYRFSTWDSKYLNEFDVFEIDGHIKDDKSWSSLGKLNATIDETQTRAYKLGDVISFGQDIKADTDFHNAFIDVTSYKQSSNYIIAEDGKVEVNIELAKALPANKDFLVQFEIYEGLTVKRRLTINEHEIIDKMRATRRRLNKGYVIPANKLSASKTLNIKFDVSDDISDATIRLATIKISQIDK